MSLTPRAEALRIKQTLNDLGVNKKCAFLIARRLIGAKLIEGSNKNVCIRTYHYYRCKQGSESYYRHPSS